MVFVFTIISLVSFSEIRKGNIAAFSISQSDIRLPYDAEIEYIASGNTGAYIDIGYKPKVDTVFEIDGFGTAQYGCMYSGNHRFHTHDNG